MTTFDEVAVAIHFLAQSSSIITSKTYPSVQFFMRNLNLQSEFLYLLEKKVMGIQSEVVRASHGQIDVAKLNLYILSLPLSLLSLTCWKGPAPVRRHLQGSFHPAHNLPPSLGS
jgi:hypothetical protein